MNSHKLTIGLSFFLLFSGLQANAQLGLAVGQAGAPREPDRMGAVSGNSNKVQESRVRRFLIGDELVPNSDHEAIELIRNSDQSIGYETRDIRTLRKLPPKIDDNWVEGTCSTLLIQHESALTLDRVLLTRDAKIVFSDVNSRDSFKAGSFWAESERFTRFALFNGKTGFIGILTIRCNAKNSSSSVTLDDLKTITLGLELEYIDQVLKRKISRDNTHVKRINFEGSMPSPEESFGDL